MASPDNPKTDNPPSATPPPANPPSSGPSQSQSKPATADPAASFYGYMFESNKTPTKLLDALLRAIAAHIIANVGDKEVTELVPKKLAAFYREAGGDYDSLFVNAPDKSISYIWQALGVQHSLQPTPNDFDPPSVPALTIRGFVRWESLQILLGPEEHVPFMQFAVRHWALKHPETGELFPPELPTQAFPGHCDPDVDKWHRECATKLRQQAGPGEEESHPPPQRPVPRDARVNSAYAHVRTPASRPVPHQSRHEHDYFTRERASTYTHIPAAARYTVPDSRPRRSVDERRGSENLSDAPPRRRSYSDIQSPTEPKKEDARHSDHQEPRRPPPPQRRHSSRLHDTSSDSESEEELVIPRHGPPRTYGPAQQGPPPITVRRVPPGPVPPQVVPMRPRRSDARSADDPRRRSFPAELRNKITSIFPGNSDRYRSSSRDRHGPTVVPAPTRSRHGKTTPPSRRSHSLSGDSYASDSDTGSPPKHRRPTEKERERERERKREIERARERQEDRDWRSRKDNAYLRPTINRRTSSHADADRRPPKDYAWDPRDPRDRGRDRDRDRDGRRIVASDERDLRDRDRDRDRDRRRYKDRGGTSSRNVSPSVMTGVGGRRYANEARYS